MHTFEDRLETTGCDKHIYTEAIIKALDEAGYTMRGIASVTSSEWCSNQLCGQDILRDTDLYE